MGVLTFVARTCCVVFIFLKGATADDGYKVTEQFAQSQQMRDLQQILLHSGYLQIAWEVLQASLLNGTNAVPSPSANPICVHHTAYMLESFAFGHWWAEDMIDAAGKPGPNIKGLQPFWVGDYKECTDVVVPVQNLTSDRERTLFQGRYCTAVIPLPFSEVYISFHGSPNTSIRFGLCVPDTCSGLDVTFLLNKGLASRNISYRVAQTSCQEATVDYDVKAIFALIICCVFFLLMIIGTTVDVVQAYLLEWKSKQQIDVASQNDEANDNHLPTKGCKDNKHKETLPLLGPKPLSMAYTILIAFSVYTNGKNILKASHAPGSITCIHGIRFLSTTWIIMYHTFRWTTEFAANYFLFAKDNYGLWAFQVFISGQIAVDTFFTLSGLLVTFLVLKEMDGNEGKVNWIRFYCHRFWRLTTPYAFFMMIYITQFRYIADGPNWPQEGPEINQCEGSWWTNLIYISNLVKTDEMCTPWTWYLSCDMQFYIVSPLLFIPLYRCRKVGVVFAGLWLLASMTIAAVIVRINDYPLDIGGGVNGDPYKRLEFFENVYIKPYCRFGSYVVGVLTGYVLYITKSQVKMSWGVAVCGWAMATATGLAVVYGEYDFNNGHYISADVSALYNACSRPAWALCVAWIIIACTSGYGGPVNTLLSWETFIPLSRLTYIAYLVQAPVIYLYLMSSPALLYMTNLNLTMQFIGATVVSFAVAFVLSLASEVPMMKLEKLVLPARKH